MAVQKRETNDYRSMSPEKAMASLESRAGGLSEAEAADRIRSFGFNEIKEVKKNPVLRFLKRYWGPMPWLLEFAMVLTFIVRHYTEGTMIFA